MYASPRNPRVSDSSKHPCFHDTINLNNSSMQYRLTLNHEDAPERALMHNIFEHKWMHTQKIFDFGIWILFYIWNLTFLWWLRVYSRVIHWIGKTFYNTRTSSIKGYVHTHIYIYRYITDKLLKFLARTKIEFK